MIHVGFRIVSQFSFLRASFVHFVSLWLVLKSHHKDAKNTKENTKKTNALIHLSFFATWQIDPLPLKHAMKCEQLCGKTR